MVKVIHIGNDKCPNCKTGYLYPTLLSLFSLLFCDYVKQRCNNCNYSQKEWNKR